MKTSWIITSLIAAIVASLLAYVLTGNWKISVISGAFVAVLVYLNNPKKRYMKAFFIVLFPLLYNFFLMVDSKTEDWDIKFGFNEVNPLTTALLGLIAIVCLVLDFLERNGKLEKLPFSSKTNKKINKPGVSSTMVDQSKNTNIGDVKTKGGDFRLGDN